MSKPQNVAIIGAGVIGASCALALAREGMNVTVFDRGPIGNGCSFGNGAQFNAGSAMPMAYPGVMSQGIKWLFDKNGPVQMSWRQLPANLSWFYQFFNTGKRSNWVATYEVLNALNSPCATLYKELLGQTSWDKISRASGALHVWRNGNPSALDAEVARLRKMRGVPFQPVNAHEIRDLEPSLSNDYIRGIFFPGSGYVVSSVGLVESLMREAASLGVEFRNCDVKNVKSKGRTLSLQIEFIEREFDTVIVAAGYASKEFARRLGVQISMASERGYHVTFPGVHHSVQRPVTDAESAVVATPVQEGLRIVGIADFDFADAKLDERQVQKLMSRAASMFPTFKPAVVNKWVGVRPSMPDSLPVIDRHPNIRNLIFATGHGHMGISGAPMTAALISDMVSGRKPRIPIDRFCLR